MCLKYGKSKTLDKSAIDLILKYPWPGNIRQLKNALETAFVYPGETISTENINLIEIEQAPKNIFIPEEGLDLDNEILPKYYEAALQRTNGNAEQAAKLLNLSPHTFRARIRTMKRKNLYE